jgi:hypothetical protein
MNRGKVVYLDDYRNERMGASRNLTAIIEGHLAEAGFWEEENDALLRYMDGNFKFRHDHLRVVHGRTGNGEPIELE